MPVIVLQRILFFSFLALSLCSPAALVTQAATNGFSGRDADERLGLEYGAQTGLGSTPVVSLVARIINVSLGLLGMIFVSLLIYAGFVWMTANGNEDRVATAKKTITAAVIGLVIILMAFTVTQFVFRAGIHATS